jgi:hypothetical protein
MDIPHIETLDEARHFILRPVAYEGAPSPWMGPIRSFQRPDLLEEAPAPDVGQTMKVGAVH